MAGFVCAKTQSFLSGVLKAALSYLCLVLDSCTPPVSLSLSLSPKTICSFKLALASSSADTAETFELGSSAMEITMASSNARYLQPSLDRFLSHAIRLIATAAASDGKLKFSLAALDWMRSGGSSRADRD